MTRTEWLKVLLSPGELKKIKTYATAEDLTMSQVVRGWIRGLPAVDPDLKIDDELSRLDEEAATAQSEQNTEDPPEAPQQPLQ